MQHVQRGPGFPGYAEELAPALRSLHSVRVTPSLDTQRADLDRLRPLAPAALRSLEHPSRTGI